MRQAKVVFPEPLGPVIDSEAQGISWPPRIGFVSSFDLPVLRYRAMIHGVSARWYELFRGTLSQSAFEGSQRNLADFSYRRNLMASSQVGDGAIEIL
jgi:hypothetical protein